MYVSAEIGINNNNNTTYPGRREGGGDGVWAGEAIENGRRGMGWSF